MESKFERREDPDTSETDIVENLKNLSVRKDAVLAYFCCS